MTEPDRSKPIRGESTDPPETWRVRRQDDNGNQFTMETGLNREEAERLVALYESRGHKQLYWFELDLGERTA
jgi:hypothetical protein